MASLNVFIFLEILDVSISWYVNIISIKANIQSRVAKIVYHVSGMNFKIIDDIIGVIIAANSQ